MNLTKISEFQKTRLFSPANGLGTYAILKEFCLAFKF